MTRIDIISGFLGAGKTTWLSQWLSHPIYKAFTTKTVILENEFGEVNLDASLLSPTGIAVSELTAGCICCTLSGDFSDKILELLEVYKPDRIVIEPSGVAKLSEVLEAVKRLQRQNQVVLGQAVTLLDATAFDSYLENFADFYQDQIKHAHQLMLNRSCDLSPQALALMEETLHQLNPTAVLHITERSNLDQLVLAMDAHFDAFTQNDFFQIIRKEHVHQHNHDTFVSHYMTMKPVSNAAELKAKLEGLLALHPSTGGIVRIKGLVMSDVGTLKVDYSGNTLTIKAYEASGPSLLCFIGQHLTLESLLEALQ